MITPLSDKVILKRCKAPEQIGSIYVPQHYRPTVPEYDVIAVGPKTQHLQAGDVVLNKENAGAAFEHKGSAYIIIREQDIIAKKE